MYPNTKDSTLYTYCPQTDNLDQNMTPLEILTFLCKIYGYSTDSTKIVSFYVIQITRELINAIGINKYRNYKIKHISSGNKRRLSVAICTIGNPSVILLDEPTAGVDPSARYLIWNLLYNIKKIGKSVLFTSHK